MDDRADCDWRDKREWQAKRRIVERATNWAGDSDDFGHYDFVLRALAAVYADAPGYRDEWRP